MFYAHQLGDGGRAGKEVVAAADMLMTDSHQKHKHKVGLYHKNIGVCDGDPKGILKKHGYICQGLSAETNKSSYLEEHCPVREEGRLLLAPNPVPNRTFRVIIINLS